MSILNNVDTTGTLSALAINPIVNFVGVCATIFGLLLATYFYLRSRKKKSPRYDIRGTNLVRDFASAFDGLELSFAGEKIKTVTATKVAFWNAGRDPLRRTDLAPMDPLRILLKDGRQILSWEILVQSNPKNNFAINQLNPTTLEISFDFVERNEGIVVQVLHSGDSSAAVAFAGTIIGGEKMGSRKNSFVRVFRQASIAFATALLKRSLSRILSIGFLAVGLTFLLVPGSAQNRIPVAFVFFSYAFLVWSAGRRRVPRGLEAFEMPFIPNDEALLRPVE